MEARTRTSLPEVTERQLEVARLIADGLDNPAIAGELGISLAGAKYHVSELLARLNLSSRDEVARWYRERERGHPFRRLSLAPLGWMAGAVGGAAAAGIAVAAIALGAGGGSEGDSVAVPAATSMPSVAQSADSGGFVPVGRPAIETRLRHTATLLDDGRVLLAGGFTLNGSRTAELLDPASATFESTTATVEGRQSHEAIRLADGRVLLIGGTPFTGGGVLASTEVYDPSDGIFHATASMTDPRWDAAVVLLEDGRVLVAGGVIENLEDGSPVITDRAELYDPTSDTFVQTGPMHASRRTHNLTLLDDGRVLVTGGGPLEVYDPATGEFSLFGGEPVFGDEGAVATLLADGRVLIPGTTTTRRRATAVTQRRRLPPTSSTRHRERSTVSAT